MQRQVGQHEAEAVGEVLDERDELAMRQRRAVHEAQARADARLAVGDPRAVAVVIEAQLHPLRSPARAPRAQRRRGRGARAGRERRELLDAPRELIGDPARGAARAGPHRAGEVAELQRGGGIRRRSRAQRVGQAAERDAERLQVAVRARGADAARQARAVVERPRRAPGAAPSSTSRAPKQAVGGRPRAPAAAARAAAAHRVGRIPSDRESAGRCPRSRDRRLASARRRTAHQRARLAALVALDGTSAATRRLAIAWTAQR